MEQKVNYCVNKSSPPAVKDFTSVEHLKENKFYACQLYVTSKFPVKNDGKSKVVFKHIFIEKSHKGTYTN
jgi:hypothetical protein